MVWLIAGLLIFLGTHSIRVLDEALRTRLIAQLGEIPWKGLYSILSIGGLALLIYGYGLARQAPVPLYELPLGVRHASTLLSWFAMVLLLAAYIPGNWFKVKWRHPMVLGVKLWAFAHLLANGNLADVILFGSFLLWAVASFSAARKRDRAILSGVAAPETSIFNAAQGVSAAPGAAAAQGASALPTGPDKAPALSPPLPEPGAQQRARPSTTVLAVVAGTLVWAGFLLDWHESLIGVSPLGR
jgi:uncharacterized membrane protein